MKRRSFVLAAGGALCAGTVSAPAAHTQGDAAPAALWLGDVYLTNREQFPQIALPVAGERLQLRRERDRRFDPRSIQVLTAAGMPLGYLPPASCAILAAMIDAGLSAFGIAGPAGNPAEQARIDLYLTPGTGPLAPGGLS